MMTIAESLLAQAVANVRGRRARPQTDAALADWLWDALGARLPARACCPEHTAPFEAFTSAYFARSHIAVWKASRGFGGKSYMLAAPALAEAATLGAEVRVLGGSADQSENVVRYTGSWTAGHGLARMLAGRPGGREAGETLAHPPGGRRHG